MRTIRATRYVTPLREGGSLPGIVEADDDGLYVLKFRGAGQGPRALVAELIVGELGRALGLPIPEIVLVDLDPSLADAEPDQEIQQLIRSSGGVNLGARLPARFARLLAWRSVRGRRPTSPPTSSGSTPSPRTRTGRRRTRTSSSGTVGRGSSITAPRSTSTTRGRNRLVHARRRFERIRDHILLPFAGPIAAADARLSGLVTETLIEALVEAIPDAWLTSIPLGDAAAQRGAYVEYLQARLASPRDFVTEADGARAA